MVPSPKKIFLADDDTDDVFMFEYALGGLGFPYELTVSYNGEELLEKLQNSYESPHIIFLDINMPKLNGLDTLAKIKETPTLQEVPVIVYSTCKNDGDILKALTGGATSYLVKPPDINDLKKVIAEILTFNWKGFTVPAELDKFVVKH